MNYAELVLGADTRGLLKAKRDLAGVRDEGARTERAVTGSMDKVDRSFDKVGGSARRMVGAAAAAAASIVSIGAALRSADQFTAMQNGLRGMGMSAAEAAASLDAIAGIAQRTRAPLEATASLYQRISMASAELGASQQEVLRFTENVGLALGASGAAAGEASGALLQLSQAMSGGTVRAEEFNSILEGAFPIALAAARGIDEAGGSVGRLRALVVEGKISSEEFFDAILSQTDALQTAFGETVPTMSQAVTVLAGGVTMLVGRLNEATGVTDGIATAIMAMGNAAFNAAAFITDNMDAVGATFNDIQGVVIAAAGALTASYIPAAYGAVTATAAWAASLVTLKGAIIATGVGALIVGTGLLIGKFFDLVDATGGWGAALSALGSLAKGIWQGIQTSAASIRPAINAVWLGVQSDFLSAMSVIVDEWSRLLSKMAGDAAAIPLIGETISKTLSEAAANAASSMSEYDAKAQGAASASARLNEEAKGLVSEGWAQAAEAAVTLRMLMDTNRDSTDDTTDAVETYNSALNESAATTGKAGKAAKAAAKDVKDLADEISRLEDAADPTRKFRREMEQLDTLLENGLSDGAYANAVRELNEELVESTPILSSVNDAFGQMVDYMFDGFKDGMRGILDIFVNTLKQMAATALKNRITIGLGLGVTGGAGAAAAGVPGGGGISSLFGGGGFLGLGGGAGSLFGGAGLLGMGGGSGFLGLGAGSGLATALGGGTLGAIGSFAIPVLGVGLALAGLFKKTEVLVAEGVRARIDGASLELDSYEKTKTDRAGLSSGFSRDFERLDDAVQSVVQTRLDATITALEQFGFGTDLTGFSFSKRTEIKDGETFEGESEEVIRNALDAVTAYLADNALEPFMQAGETVSMTLERLSTSLAATNQSLDFFGGTLLPISLDGAAAAAALTDLYGGLENFAASASFLFENFYTESQKQEIALGQLTEALGELGQEVPATHQAYLDLINAQDLMTEEGRNLHAALGQLAPLFVTVYGAAEDTTAALQDHSALLLEEARLLGDVEYIRAQEMAALDETGQEIQQRIYDLQDEQAALAELAAIERERAGLMSQLYRLTGNETALRQQQLASLNESNRALQKHIWLLEDQAEALQEGLIAAQNLAAAAEEDLAEARRDEADAIAALKEAYANLDRVTQDRIDTFQDEIEGYKNLIEAAEDALTVLGVIPEVKTPLQEAEEATRAYEDALSQLGAAINNERDALNANIEAWQDEITAISEKVYEESQALIDARTAYESALGELSAGIDRERSKLEAQLSEQQNQYDSLYAALFPSNDEDITAALEVRDVMGDALSIAERLANAARDVFRLNEDVVEQQRVSALAQLRAMTLSGNINPDTIDQTVSAATSFNSNEFSSFEDMAFAQKQTGNVLQELSEIQRQNAASLQAEEEARAEEARQTALSQLYALETQIETTRTSLGKLDLIAGEFGLLKEELSVGTLAQIATRQEEAYLLEQELNAAEIERQKEIDAERTEQLEGLIADAKAQIGILNTMETDFGLVTRELTAGDLKQRVITLGQDAAILKASAIAFYADQIEANTDLIDAAETEIDILKDIRETNGLTVDAVVTVGDAVNALTQALAGVTSATNNVQDALDALAAANDGVTSAQDDLDDLLNPTSGMSSAEKRLFGILQNLEGALDATFLGSDAFGQFSEDNMNAFLTNAAVNALDGIAAKVADAYDEVFGRNVDVLGLQHYIDKLSSDSYGIAELLDELKKSTEAITGVIPGFAIGGGSSSGGGSSGGGSSSGGGGSSGLSAADLNGTAVFPKPNDIIGALYGTYGVPISKSGYDFWSDVNDQHGYGAALSGFLEAAEKDGTLNSVPSYKVGTNYHPGGWARLHENELVNLPRGTSVSTAGEVKEMVEVNKSLLEENKKMLTELKWLRRLAQSRTDIEEDRRAEELAQ